MGVSRFTIYTDYWQEAEQRVPSLSEPVKTLAEQVREVIERGWERVAEVAGVVEDRLRSLDPNSPEPDAVIHHFLDADVVDTFREVAIGWYASVLDWPDHSPEDMEADLTVFRRYLTVAELASRAEGVDPTLRAALAAHIGPLQRWCDDVAPVFLEFADALPQ